MMECYIHPSIDYTRIPETIAAQREFILRRIREVAQSHRVIYPPLATGSTLMDGTGSSKTTRLSITSHHAPSSSSRGNEAVSRAMAIPGVFEAGWTVADLMGSTTIQKDVDRQRNHMKSEMLSIIRKTEEQAFSWPFREPVDTTEVKDYLEVITDPIDLSTIEKRIKRGDWYKSKQMLRADLVRMVNNCKTYNDSSSPYYECAVSLEKYLPTLFPDM